MKTIPEPLAVVLAGTRRRVRMATERVMRTPLLTGGAFTLIEDTAYFCYVGEVPFTFTPQYVTFQVRGGGTGAQTAEVGLFSTTGPPNKGALSLTKITATGTVDDLTTTGAKRNTTAFTTLVRAGTYLWAGIRTAMATNEPALIGCSFDFAQGYIQTTATAGVLTGAGPWTGSIPAVGLSPIGPDLRVEED